MSFLKRLFGIESNSPKAQSQSLESILMLEDRALYDAIQGATADQSRRISLAVAREAVTRAGLRHLEIPRAYADLESGRVPNSALAAIFGQLADDLDVEDGRQQEEWEGKNVGGERDWTAFHQARAASSIASALEGRADEAIYEAIHAIEDLPKVRELVLAALRK